MLSWINSWMSQYGQSSGLLYYFNCIGYGYSAFCLYECFLPSPNKFVKNVPHRREFARVFFDKVFCYVRPSKSSADGFPDDFIVYFISKAVQLFDNLLFVLFPLLVYMAYQLD